jgi:D-3-phosphoglycerate dehydrogenase
MISDREFDLMKPTAVLINACRGPVVDEAALIRALQQKKIMAAGLDVLEEEPTPADNPLLDMDNVIVTPHLAAFAQESYDKSRAFAVQNAARVARGEAAQSVVDYFA